MMQLHSTAPCCTHLHRNVPSPGAFWSTATPPRQRLRLVHTTCLRGDQSLAKPWQLLRLPLKAGYSDVYLMGVEHETSQMTPADFILQHKPAVVVFENSFSAAGGNGAIVSCDDKGSQDGSAALTALCRLAAEMSCTSNPHQLQAGWQQLGASLDSEMLAHVAAFRVGATVIHADRPVVDKFLRLYQATSLQDLDAAVGVQSCINYADMLSQPLEHSSLRAAAAVYHIHIMERDIIMNQALEDAASQQPGPVIGIFGADHVQGIASQWETSAAQLSEKAFSMVDISPQSIFKESQTCQGVRHALFERFFELSASHGTCAAMQHYLPHLPDGAREAYELTKEIYGSTRMMLACLSQQDLVEVCSGWDCDVWSLLAPIRALRPVNGGQGYDEDLAIELRQLMLEIN